MSQRSGYFGPILQPIGLAINKGGPPAWNPRALFAAGEQGAWYDPSDLSTLFQDSAGTTPVTAVGQPVGLVKDKSGRGNHASQATATARPLLQQDAGGRYYLSFDGTDDSLATGTISFAATNKVTAWAAVRKASDTAIGMLAELSADRNANTGTFGITAPGAAGGVNNSYNFGTRGTASLASAGAGTFPAPDSAVLTAIGDIGADICSISRNGVALATTVADQGAGNYGNYPLYIGSRGGSSLRFSGRLYGLIVRGAASTAAQIASAERYLAARSGVTL